MSSPQYFTSYSPFSGVLSSQSHYSQAVRIGDRIECSGQGNKYTPGTTTLNNIPPKLNKPCPPETGTIPSSLPAEIDLAFANVDACLRSASCGGPGPGGGSGSGWRQVYRVNLYTTVEMGEEMVAAWAACMRKWAGEDHRPLLTGVGVAALAVPGMRVEIEVVAFAQGQSEGE
ncbi:Endoribonuclease L-PSP/chorismate mutase-like protein [Chaetomidium leptoderma]|uniref:Endoribonuclease L-PSP/chorismate mutase-like protein n=1 Tax=Chaetomidium leptoderma TaxID=669021 RepID=A0AAN6VFR8_9PEZI|nr:Endoribonuclease L-PSP/chorismate mutase-like protein [Chaetomidium leptoderma]